MSPARPDPGGGAIARGGPSLRRRISDRGLVVLCSLAAAVGILPLILIVVHLVSRGLPALDLAFFLHNPRPVGEPGGGMANALVGTRILVAIATLIAVPIGIGAGLYLSEFGDGRLGVLVRTTADVLGGVPSIVMGVAAYGLIVVPMGRFSAIAGGVALAMLMLPTIVRSTEEVVRLVPRSYRAAALALGASRWRVVQDVVVPAAAGGIVTAILLGVARAAGETAPLLFTALGSRFFSVAI